MSFLTAASDRSSSGSGVSGVSGASFSGASSFFSLSFWTALVLLAIHHLLDHAAHCAHKSLLDTLRGHVASLRPHLPKGHQPPRILRDMPGGTESLPSTDPLRRRLPVTKKAPLPYAGRIAVPLPGSGHRSATRRIRPKKPA